MYESLKSSLTAWDDTTGLPKPSYDLWEEVFLTTTYTTSVTHAALLAAAELAEDADDSENAVKWRSVADDILAASHKYLFNKDRQSFYKGVIVKDGTVEYNDTIDASSIYGAFMFGLFSTDSEELQAAMKSYVERFKNPDGKIGFPRYENDNYHLANSDSPGNWWPIVTMWYAQFCLEHGDADTAQSIIQWVKEVSTSTGMIPEQINPADGSRISPSPLTWSQAEYVSTLLDTITEHPSK